MFHNISNPKWFGNWSRLEDDYLGNGGTDIADNFTFSKMEKTGGLFGSIIRLATAFPACDPETGHATGAWKVACESIDLDEVPLSDIADMICGFDCETITDFRLFNTGAFDNTPWQQALGELLLRLRIEKDDYQWIQCPNSESAVNMMNMVMDAHMPKDFFDGFVCGDEEYGLERLQQAELHPLLRPVTGYGCLRVRMRQENRCARRPIRASACGKLLRSRY